MYNYIFVIILKFPSLFYKIFYFFKIFLLFFTLEIIQNIYSWILHILLDFLKFKEYTIPIFLKFKGGFILNDLIEIRWHGRGGQGAKTASLLLADAAFNTGKYIQGFPEYGPERMGAPITAYNRISNSPITIHSNIYEPDYVVVVDDSLLEAVNVTEGLKETGAIIINTTKNKEEISKLLPNYKGGIYTIDAKTISIEALGKYFPNTPMLAAIVKVSNIMEEEAFMKDMLDSFKHKFAKKPEVIDGNMKALEMALKSINKLQ